ncbi:MAG: DUF4429 domain-containing protein [Verrucomicrobiota bacterium]
MMTKCPCLNCGGPIQFEANDLADDNRTIACPHCAQETSLFVPIHKQVNEMEIRGNNENLELAKDKVIIRRFGTTNAQTTGLNSDRVINISDITGIQMKPAATMSGYILFSLADSEPFDGGAVEASHHPDAFIFGQESNEEVASFKWKVEQLMHEIHQHPAPKPPQVTLAEELRALAEMKQQGLLTDAEFEVAKKKLLA